MITHFVVSLHEVNLQPVNNARLYFAFYFLIVPDKWICSTLYIMCGRR